VSLEISHCDMAAEIRRLVSLELGNPVADETPADSTRAAVICDASRATLRVVDPSTAKELARIVDLEAEVPKGRARLVALALVELISASQTELATEPATHVSVATPVGATRASIVPSASTPFRVVMLAGGREFGRTDALVGGGARVVREGDWLGWLADVEVHHGTTAVSLGRTSTDLVDAAGAVSVHRGWQGVGLSLAVGLRGGTARLAGSSNLMGVTAGKFWGPWLGAVGVGSVDVHLWSRWALDLAVEAGQVISPLGGLVDARREVAIDGAWMGIHLGVGTIL
jgi:hypothetical protein